MPDVEPHELPIDDTRPEEGTDFSSEGMPEDVVAPELVEKED